MKRFVLIAVVSTSIVGIATIYGKGEEPDDLRAFMRLKLKHSQEVLDGLVTEDFEAIAKHSQELALLSQASNWQVFQTKDYVQYSTDFRRAASAITKAAKEKNLDGATLAYVDVTMKCVQCHKYVRGIRMAAAEPRNDFRAIANLTDEGIP